MNLKIRRQIKDMNIEDALFLTDSSEIYRAAIEAERRNVDHGICKKLWRNYEKALNREYIEKMRKIN